MNLFKYLVCIFLIGGGPIKGTSPINILDSIAYRQQRTLDNADTFLGFSIPKYLSLQLTAKDQYLTQSVLDNALETSPSFVGHKWHNLDNQHQGSITVMPIKDLTDHKCRVFQIQLMINDRRYDLEGEACRINGKWNILTRHPLK